MGFNTKSYSSMTWMMQGYPRNFGNPHILITRWLLTHVLSMMLTKLMMLPSIYHPFTIHLPSIYHPFTIHFAVLYLYSYPISPALLTPAGLGHPWRMALMRQPWGQCTLRWLPCKLILWGGCIIGVYHNYIINIYIYIIYTIIYIYSVLYIYIYIFILLYTNVYHIIT